MSKHVLYWTLAATVALAASAIGNPAAAKKVTLKGEIVDTGCYLGHGAHGEKHIGCATKCIANGMPISLLTSSGKLYLLTPNHDNLDPFTKAKDLAGQTVEVSGTLMQGSGLLAIDVTDVKAATSAK